MKNKFGCNHLSFSYYFQVYIFIYFDIVTAKGKGITCNYFEMVN